MLSDKEIIGIVPKMSYTEGRIGKWEKKSVKCSECKRCLYNSGKAFILAIVLEVQGRNAAGSTGFLVQHLL